MVCMIVLIHIISKRKHDKELGTINEENVVSIENKDTSLEKNDESINDDENKNGEVTECLD